MGSAALSGLQTLLHLHPWNLHERLILALRDGGFVRDPIPRCASTAITLSRRNGFLLFRVERSGRAHLRWTRRGTDGLDLSRRGRSLRDVRHIGLPHSLGWFYSCGDRVSGWDANEGEVKLMGLAPYGRPEPTLRAFVEEFLQLTDDGVRIDPDCMFYGRRSYGRFFGDKLVDGSGPPQPR
jgi:hypothetical protein